MKKKSLLVLLTILSILISSILTGLQERVLADEEPNYLTFTAITDSSITLSYDSGTNVSYSINGGVNWSKCDSGQVVSLEAGKSIMYKGIGVNTSSTNHFSMTGKIAASGSVTSLTDSYGDDPWVQLSDNCYNYMFYGCTALIKAPDILAYYPDSYCYYKMFSGCTNLETLPNISSLELDNFCYAFMFEGCASIKSIPMNYLPLKTLNKSCYNGMFKGCTGLVDIPVELLPAGKDGEGSLADGCYEEMFSGCTSLKIISRDLLPATSLKNACYKSMFSGCTSLTTLPDLLSKMLSVDCYKSMFSGCSSIKLSTTKTSSYTNEFRIPKTGTGTALEDSLTDMFKSTGGDFTGTPNINTTYYAIAPDYLTFTAITDSSVTLYCDKGNDIYYSIDASANWVQYNKGQQITLKAGEKVLFKGLYVTTTSGAHFSMTGKIKASGSVTSLTDSYGGNPGVALTDNCYSYMFYKCTSLISAPNLPATSLTNYCYYGMFAGCTNLETIRCFPVSSLASFCYGGMFNGCTSLTSLPENLLPTTSLADYCYNEMFKACTNLKDLPAGLLPAGKGGNGSLAQHCYEDMFLGCTGLKTVPKELLPATNLDQACYRSMFKNCTSLTTLPDLPSEFLYYYCYKNMFEGCSNIKLSTTKVDLYTSEFRIPKVGTATVLTDSLYEMFKNTGGTFTGTPDANTTYYLYEANYLTLTVVSGESIITPMFVSGTYQYSIDNGATWITGTNDGSTEIYLEKAGDKVLFSGKDCITNDENHFYMSGTIMASGDVTSLTNNDGGNATLPKSSYAYMFSGCDSLISVPNLPSTTLNEYCYQGMFIDCDGLISIPKNLLPATTLAKNCYEEMFQNCNSLVIPPALPATILADYCYQNMFYGCSNIKLSTEKTGLYINEYRIPTSGTGTTGTDSLTDMFDQTGGTFKGTPNINTTYYYSKKSQTLSFNETSVTKTYGDTAFTNELSGAQTTITYSSDDTSIAKVNASTGEVTIVKAGTTTIKVSAIETDVYASATASYTLEVKKVQVDVPIAESDLVYNKTEQKGVVLPSGAPYTLSNNKGTNAKTYTATATLTNKDNYEWKLATPTSNDQTITWSIAKKELTINGTTVANKTYDGNNTATVTMGKVEGIEIGDTVSVKVKAVFNNKNVGTSKDVAIVYKLEGTDASNYSVSDDKTYADITPKKLTIKGTTVANKTYDGNTTANATAGTLVGVIEGDTVLPKVKTATFSDKNVGTNKDVTVKYELSGTRAFNYDVPADDTIKANITKKQLSATNTTVQSTKEYDGTKTLTVTAKGSIDIIDGDSVTLDATATYDDKNVGTGKSTTVVYEISGEDANNYIKPKDNKTLTASITPKQLSINGTTVADKEYDGTTTANATPGTLADVIEGDTVLPKIKTATFIDKNVGTDIQVTIEYKLEGTDASNYQAPNDETSSANITQKSVTVQADNKSMIQGSSVPKFTATITGVIGTDSVSYTFDSVVPQTQGVYSITFKQKQASQGNYYVTFKDGYLAVNSTSSDVKVDSKALSKVLEIYKAKPEYQDKTIYIEDKTTKKETSNNKIVYDVQIFLNVDGTTIDIGDEITTLIPVTYAFDFTNKTDIHVSRDHKGTVSELTTTPNLDGEYIVLNKNQKNITVYAKKYSTYTITFNISPTPPYVPVNTSTK